MQGLRQLGWTEGQNLRIDVRWSAADAELARVYAAQLIGLMPDVILAVSTTNLTVIRQATSTVPVVFTQVSDPVAQGFVASPTKPGGNLTGFSQYEFSVGGKWLTLLGERCARPHPRRHHVEPGHVAAVEILPELNRGRRDISRRAGSCHSGSRSGRYRARLGEPSRG